MKKRETFEMIEKMFAGDRRALARVISLIEDRGDDLRKIIDAIYPNTGNAFVLGITGPPGAGKSTVTDKLVTQIRNQTGQKVAVVCVDPSSPFTGGAILGDRIRMQAHHDDSGVYIRSLGTRGKHGGLSQSSKEVVLALDSAGFEWIIVETAGVGQTELDILKLAHMVCVILVPESGDSIQMMKAGLMEIADVFIVNKSDRPEADKLVRELVTVIGMNEKHSTKPEWKIPVLKTEAIHGIGIDEIFAQLQAFKGFAIKHGSFKKKRLAFIADEILEIINNKVNQVLKDKIQSESGQKILDSVLNLSETPHEAADKFSYLILDQKTLK